MKTNQPLFSVLIANYNNGKYLMEAIESVRQQTYANWEIILVDDASKDNSEELYVELEKDERIHIYRNEQNMGCGYTKRRCAELAQGEVCGFLDPDDVITKDALQVMVDAHLQYPEVSTFYSQHYVADANLSILFVDDTQTTIPANTSFLEYGKAAISHFVTFKTTVYKQSCGTNAYLLRAVDHDLYYLLEELGPMKFIQKPLYIYRTGTSNNISIGKNQYIAAMWDIIAQYEACRRRGYSNAVYENFISRDIASIELSITQYAKNEVYKAKTYRIGRALLFPFRLVKRWLKIQ